MKQVTRHIPQVIAPAEEHLGPAMQALTELQRNFVVALVTTGARNKHLAMRMAGYQGNDNVIDVGAHRMGNNPKVQAAIKEEADKLLRAGGLLGAAVLIEIAGDPMHKDRFKAGVELLNRTGLIVATEHKVTVEDKRTNDEMLTAIFLMAKRQGLDPATLLGKEDARKAEKIIDGEFTEVVDGSMEGLEDLI